MYWFSLRLVPKTIINIMDKLRRDFCWGNLKEHVNSKRKMHLIKWDKVCSGKQRGGLSLMRLRDRNLAMLAKWWWKFHIDRDKYWMRFLCNKYGGDFPYGKLAENMKMSNMMRDIWRCSSENNSKKLVTMNMFKWKVGDGTLVKF